MSSSVQRLEMTGNALRTALEQQDWAVIGDLDRECRQAVEDAMVDAVRDEAQLKQNLEELLALYRDLVQVCQEHQQKLAGELVQIQQGQQGARVYKLFS